MKSRAFLYNVADAYRIEHKTLVVYDRFLKEAGLLTTGARGVNAPDMTPLDAARLTIALLATDKPARAVEMCERFRSMPYRPDISSGETPPIALGLKDGMPLEQALANYFNADPNAGINVAAPYVEIRENARMASIKFSGEKPGEAVFLDHGLRAGQIKFKDFGDLLGIRRTRGLSSAELGPVQLIFYREHREGLTWEQRYRGTDDNGNPLDPAHPWNANMPPDEQSKRLEEIREIISQREAEERSRDG